MRLSIIEGRLAGSPAGANHARRIAGELRRGTGGCFLQAPERILLAVLAFAGLSTCPLAQTASTGALTGRLLDPSGALIPGAEIRLTNPGSGYFRSEISDGNGNFHFLLLLPGKYDLKAAKTGFSPSRINGVNVLVTETLQLQLHLRLAGVAGTVQVSSTTPMVQASTTALGRVVNHTAVTGLPLVTRDFA